MKTELPYYKFNSFAGDTPTLIDDADKNGNFINEFSTSVNTQILFNDNYDRIEAIISNEDTPQLTYYHDILDNNGMNMMIEYDDQTHAVLLMIMNKRPNIEVFNISISMVDGVKLSIKSDYVTILNMTTMEEWKIARSLFTVLNGLGDFMDPNTPPAPGTYDTAPQDDPPQDDPPQDDPPQDDPPQDDNTPPEGTFWRLLNIKTGQIISKLTNHVINEQTAITFTNSGSIVMTISQDGENDTHTLTLNEFIGFMIEYQDNYNNIINNIKLPIGYSSSEIYIYDIPINITDIANISIQLHYTNGIIITNNTTSMQWTFTNQILEGLHNVQLQDNYMKYHIYRDLPDYYSYYNETDQFNALQEVDHTHIALISTCGTYPTYVETNNNIMTVVPMKNTREDWIEPQYSRFDIITINTSHKLIYNMLIRDINEPRFELLMEDGVIYCITCAQSCNTFNTSEVSNTVKSNSIYAVKDGSNIILLTYDSSNGFSEISTIDNSSDIIMYISSEFSLETELLTYNLLIKNGNRSITHATIPFRKIHGQKKLKEMFLSGNYTNITGEIASNISMINVYDTLNLQSECTLSFIDINEDAYTSNLTLSDIGSLLYVVLTGGKSGTYMNNFPLISLHTMDDVISFESKLTHFNTKIPINYVGSYNIYTTERYYTDGMDTNTIYYIASHNINIIVPKKEMYITFRPTVVTEVGTGDDITYSTNIPYGAKLHLSLYNNNYWGHDAINKYFKVYLPNDTNLTTTSIDTIRENDEDYIKNVRFLSFILLYQDTDGSYRKLKSGELIYSDDIPTTIYVMNDHSKLYMYLYGYESDIYTIKLLGDQLILNKQLPNADVSFNERMYYINFQSRLSLTNADVNIITHGNTGTHEYFDMDIDDGMQTTSAYSDPNFYVYDYVNGVNKQLNETDTLFPSIYRVYANVSGSIAKSLMSINSIEPTIVNTLPDVHHELGVTLNITDHVSLIDKYGLPITDKPINFLTTYNGDTTNETSIVLDTAGLVMIQVSYPGSVVYNPVRMALQSTVGKIRLLFNINDNYLCNIHDIDSITTSYLKSDIVIDNMDLHEFEYNATINEMFNITPTFINTYTPYSQVMGGVLKLICNSVVEERQVSQVDNIIFLRDILPGLAEKYEIKSPEITISEFILPKTEKCIVLYNDSGTEVTKTLSYDEDFSYIPTTGNEHALIFTSGGDTISVLINDIRKLEFSFVDETTNVDRLLIGSYDIQINPTVTDAVINGATISMKYDTTEVTDRAKLHIHNNNLSVIPTDTHIVYGDAINGHIIVLGENRELFQTEILPIINNNAYVNIDTDFNYDPNMDNYSSFNDITINVSSIGSDNGVDVAFQSVIFKRMLYNMPWQQHFNVNIDRNQYSDDADTEESLSTYIMNQLYNYDWNGTFNTHNRLRFAIVPNINLDTFKLKMFNEHDNLMNNMSIQFTNDETVDNHYIIKCYDSEDQNYTRTAIIVSKDNFNCINWSFDNYVYNLEINRNILFYDAYRINDQNNKTIFNMRTYSYGTYSPGGGVYETINDMSTNINIEGFGINNIYNIISSRRYHSAIGFDFKIQEHDLHFPYINKHDQHNPNNDNKTVTISVILVTSTNTYIDNITTRATSTDVYETKTKFIDDSNFKYHIVTDYVYVDKNRDDYLTLPINISFRKTIRNTISMYGCFVVQRTFS